MAISILILFIISLSGLIITHNPKIEKKILENIISLGAWVMISISIVHIMPESIKLNEKMVFAFIIGFILIYFIENFLMVHSCVEHECHYHNISIVSWIALFVHTFFDWIGIWAWYLSNSNLWYIILAWVAIHQIPVSVSISSLLRHSNFTKKIQTFMMILFALSAPLWFIGSFLFLSWVWSEFYTSLFLAISGGSLLYIWASDLLPTIHKNSKNRNSVIIFFLIWIIVTSLAKFLEF
ncbi:MAG: hypothetical protein ACD_49C00075G0004 [uncultured bacterium (gcode 4)]|uniref:Zinc/iron permease n=1 Tax=uncultured bacterium (gcode 4) TaxID=1234023 RepID=K2AVK6_9BACT|nr:MAG: hypothetical protein ACD_49C00075G0004 [uncultured bacterium (gcode 4)]